MRIAYFDCFSGISGDMTLGALLDAGLDMKVLSRGLKKLKLGGYTIKASKARRGEFVGTKFDCVITGRDGHDHRSLKDILRLIERSPLKPDVKEAARAVFLAIGRAEAKIHGVRSIDEVRLHELGWTDSLVDIVGTALALDALGIDEVRASPVTLGRGFVKGAHGAIPLPGPASVELLKGAPVKMSQVEAELVTPTGAGILKALAGGFGSVPDMKISAVGYGAGTRVLKEIPNMLRVIIGETGSSFKDDAVFVIETNIDDMSPQFFEYIFERLFKEGALDVYATHIQMKKSRPAFKLTVLAKEKDLEGLSAVIFRETTAIGVRYHEAKRFKLEREDIQAGTKYGKVGVKVSTGPGGIRTVSPEYADCIRIARAKKVPLKVVYAEALRKTF
ncbi:MAG: nickel pincer cofactor biosynthesis protein LarC [Candidatus Omnitrophota bacterium]